MQYYIRNHHIKSGPFELDELLKQKLTKDTLVWYDGLFNWTKACELLELTDLFQPPVSGKKTVREIL